MRRCCVPGCKNNDQIMRLHSLPYKHKDLYDIWVKRINHPIMLKIEPEHAFKRYRICTDHFSTHCRVPSRYRSFTGLIKRALPTLNLPGFEDPPTFENSFLPYPASVLAAPLSRPDPTWYIKKTSSSAKQVAEVCHPLETVDMSDNTDTDITVRKATRCDMHQVCRLIKELAKFEKLEDQAKITPETLIEDGFDTNSPAFSCFVDEVNNGTIIGYAIYYTCYSTWLGKSIFLEDLYVEPVYRKCGIGKELMLSVARVAYQTSKRLDFHVLKWNPAVDFYKSLGAENLSTKENWQLFRLDENSLSKLFSD